MDEIRISIAVAEKMEVTSVAMSLTRFAKRVSSAETAGRSALPFGFAHKFVQEFALLLLYGYPPSLSRKRFAAPDLRNECVDIPISYHLGYCLVHNSVDTK